MREVVVGELDGVPLVVQVPKLSEWMNERQSIGR